MGQALRYGGQIVVYALIMLVIGYLSDTPAYQAAPPEQAMIKLAFKHGGQPRGGCRKPTRQETDDMAMNMRRRTICPREREPLLVELSIDGETVYSRVLQPAGLRDDGPARVYESFVVAPGQHRIDAKLRDSSRDEGFDYVASKNIELAPSELYVIQFRSESGGFLMK